MTIRDKRYERGEVVAVMGFTPVRQELDATEAVPHSSSKLVIDVVYNINIPRGVNAMLVQAITQNIRYTISQNSSPSKTSGFRLTAGNDPLVIPIDPQTSELRFVAEAAGAMLEYQFGVI
jgi:hypothetical protein